ncbi:MAG TPA: tryptophan--tRNA ligase [Methanolinea sp.]|nr:tryptophan--tRNA ligase [Methanolinea sp.]HPC54653.1 tryptophan--tRNA ligase [Methanolinea sp.]HQE85618.1 tryptophan--tRNA ligase [Methanolinea sp.]HQI14449.1 tryptophan--tRNA ligase [Methanolinea sp.]HQJ18867.1 tryptophan--tRNA ligase [Methanolinea sp.]
METPINPWSSQQTDDIEKLFSLFGIEHISTIEGILPKVPSFISRGVVVGHRDYRVIAEAIRDKRPFHILTGFMPSGHPHLGHLMVMKEVVWHVQQGGSGYITIADREAHAVRDISWQQCEHFGKEYLQCLFALGYRGRTYFQSRNNALKDLAFEAATRVNFSELQAIYGFSDETSLAHAESVITQVADILFPQVDSYPAPTLVPVGIDQDPHIRLTRGIAHKLRMFTVEERDGYISVRSKNAPEEALAEVHRKFPGSRKYQGHVDIPRAGCAEVSAEVRKIEIAHGGYGFYTPSSTYHRFIPGLQGGKMSSSIPESTITFSEPDDVVRKKVMGAFTGGRATLAEQKELGGEPEKCPVFLLNLFHMVDDDAELAEIHRRCRGGELMCGQCKKETTERVLAFIHDFREKMEASAHMVKVE